MTDYFHLNAGRDTLLNLSSLGLAHLGDSVYEVMVREYLLRQANQPAAKLHDQKVQLVCAAFQGPLW
mgnify:CR=1 FL=1